MLDELDAERFRGCLNQTFTLDLGDGQTLATELIQVSELQAHTRREDRQPFSLLFRGPLDAPLEQRIYAFENETLGRFEVFLVTIGPDENDEGMLYEVVFT